MNKLTDRQIRILQSLRQKAQHGDAVLLEDTIEGRLSLGDVQKICELINDEYLMYGINADYSPNEYGRELEMILNIVNAPRLAL